MDTVDHLVAEIERAFDKVALEDGIGIYEADALDACVSDTLRAKARSTDTREDWRSIPDDVISEHYVAMPFLDDKGIRFALPAYMLFAIRNWSTSHSASVDHVIYTLARDMDWSFLTDEQHRVIAKFLNFVVLEAGESVDSWQASLAYEKYWGQFADDG